MNVNGCIIDRRLVERAERNEEAVIVDGATDSGLPVLVVVCVGANTGLFKQYCKDVLPDAYRMWQEAKSIMADRNGADIMGDVFLILAENPTEANKELARQVWDTPWSKVDATWQQMGIDEALEKLGLMWRNKYGDCVARGDG